MSYEAKFIQQGAAIDYTPTSAVAAGQVVPLGDMVGVAKIPIAANELGALAVEGVFECPKKSADTLTRGSDVYWDDTNNEVTSTSTSNTPMGKAVETKVATTTTVQVLINR